MGGDAAGQIAMPQDQDPYSSNDTKLLTPLLVMGLIIVVGLLYYGYFAHA
jgi:hypothetical protein